MIVPTGRRRRCDCWRRLRPASLRVPRSSAACRRRRYPKKPIELVVPFTAGGTTDNIARLISQRFTESWGATVVVNNRPGSGGTIGDRDRRQGAARRPHAAGDHDRLCHHPCPAEAALRSDQGLRADHRACLVAADAGGARLAAGDQSQGVHRVRHAPSRARSIMPRPASALRRISPARCSRPWPASTWCTCRTRAMRRCERDRRRPREGLFQPGAGDRCSTYGTGRCACLRSPPRSGCPICRTCRPSPNWAIPTTRSARGRACSHRPARRRTSSQRSTANWCRCSRRPTVRARITREGADPVGSTPEEFAARIRSELDKWAKVAKGAGLPTPK